MNTMVLADSRGDVIEAVQVARSAYMNANGVQPHVITMTSNMIDRFAAQTHAELANRDRVSGQLWRDEVAASVGNGTTYLLGMCVRMADVESSTPSS